MCFFIFCADFFIADWCFCEKSIMGHIFWRDFYCRGSTTGMIKQSLKKYQNIFPCQRSLFCECQLEEPVRTSISGSSLGRETAQQIIVWLSHGCQNVLRAFTLPSAAKHSFLNVKAITLTQNFIFSVLTRILEESSPFQPVAKASSSKESNSKVFLGWLPI